MVAVNPVQVSAAKVAAAANQTLRQQRKEIANKSVTRSWMEPNETGFIQAAKDEVDATIVEALLDKAQQTAINRRILASATKQQAKDAGNDSFQYGIFLDWRGRLYTNGCGLAPQGKDAGRGVLTAAEPLRLGKEGLYHLAVGVATCWGGGGIDKAHPDERAAWTNARVADGWLAEVVQGGIDGTSYEYRLAEEPVQFLGLAADYLASGGDEGYESSVFVGYDATCSGIQILAALAKDCQAASLVNVLPRADGKRADVYLTCAEKLSDIVAFTASCQDQALSRTVIADNSAAANSEAWAVYWNDRLPLSRGWLKKPVMVANYGGTVRTFAASFREDTRAPWKACLWLAKTLWEQVLAALMPRAQRLMEWFQDVASILSSHGKPIAFTSDNGLPFRQEVFETVKDKVEIRLPMSKNRVEIILQEPTDKLNKMRQKTGSSPNIVHHFDGLFLQNAILGLVDTGITTFFTVHDCFYLRAGDWAEGWHVLRRVFRDTFAGDVLEKLKEKLETESGVKLPEIPELGDLDLDEVLTSVFLFS